MASFETKQIKCPHCGREHKGYSQGTRNGKKLFKYNCKGFWYLSE